MRNTITKLSGKSNTYSLGCVGSSKFCFLLPVYNLSRQLLVNAGSFVLIQRVCMSFLCENIHIISYTAYAAFSG